MVKYYFENETFVIEDFQKAKTFASFLPAVAGLDGKPLWAFYANVGQAMGGFGVDNKDTPITPFDSANLAYQNIPIKSFRTFIKIDGKIYTPFFNSNDAKQVMKINKSNFSISEETDLYSITITYSSVPHKNYAALIRKVNYVNKSSEAKTFEVYDGLPIFFPHGLSNFCYKELVSLMSAYCCVKNLDKKAPFVKFKTSTGDNSIVKEAVSGNGFMTIDMDGNRLNNIVDPYLVFENDLSLLHAEGINNSFEKLINDEQQTENKLPCAFSCFKKELASKASYVTYSVYGTFDSIEVFEGEMHKLSSHTLDEMIDESENIISKLLESASIKTSNKIFDLYMKQSMLDNSLRGGFPILLENNKENKEVYYVYSRKHGDMERDYNSFQIPSKYYSSGCGNFRDVNQNRRSDLYFAPFVKDYNIYLFFSLIQADGQNPLNVKPLSFTLNENYDKSILDYFDESLMNQLQKILKRFEPSELYTFIKDNESLVNDDANKIFAHILENSHQQIEANFAEGYWVDHWTYNVDLLENYVSVYPDKLKELLFRDDYKYFYSPVYVEPRDEKYSLLENGTVRQYGAIDLKRLKDECEKRNIDIKETHWLKDENGKEIKTTLASKIINLITIKFSTLDSYGLGIEMECEKPGWNDAMNGLPGLFASGMSETVELLRLVNFALKSFAKFSSEKVHLLQEQYDFLLGIKAALQDKFANKISQFEYWDRVTSLRELFRKEVRYNASGKECEMDLGLVITIFEQFKLVLQEGIKKAHDLGKGIIPSYLVYEVEKYEKTGHINHLGYPTVKVKSFKLKMIPPFLEASARALKLGKEIVSLEDYENIKKSDIYDHKLNIYKTCADIENAPFEIGRVHAFTKGWLERECNFLHMTYKYLLGLLKAGYYKEFYQECQTNLVINMDPMVYGRSIIENSSFIVPTCNPDKKLHGRGFFARLTGANAEFMDMFANLFIGPSLFNVENDELVLTLSPKLNKEMFDENNEAQFTLFNKTKVIYHNPNCLNTYDAKVINYVVDGVSYSEIRGKLALDLRNGVIKEIHAYLG